MKNKGKKPATRRIRMLVKRAVSLRAKASRLYGKANETVQLARNCGLTPGQQIEIEIPSEDGSIDRVPFELVDNLDEFTLKDKISRAATVNRFELKPVPKARRMGPIASPEDVTP